jgi:hypothetical protein
LSGALAGLGIAAGPCGSLDDVDRDDAGDLELHALGYLLDDDTGESVEHAIDHACGDAAALHDGVAELGLAPGCCAHNVLLMEMIVITHYRMERGICAGTRN